MVAGGIVRESGMGTYTLIYLKHNQQGPTHFIAQGTLLNIMWHLDGKGVWGRMDTCVCMAESLAVHLKLSHC